MTMNDTTPLLACRGLTKRFAAASGHGAGPSAGTGAEDDGSVLANDAVDLDLFAGRVHALLGENGAGKSTLMSMLSGWLRPDSGQLFLSGAPLVLSSPAAAMRAGIGMVHQRFSLVEALTGAENLALATGGAPDPKAAAALAERLGLPLDPRKRVAELSMGERQRLEILKLLARDARIMILDEPTSVLAPTEISGLYRTVRRLADEGRAVVLITHKLSEIAGGADEVSVLRRGRMVARNLPRTDGPRPNGPCPDGLRPNGPCPDAPQDGENASTGWDIAELSRLMVGCEVPGAPTRQRQAFPPGWAPPGWAPAGAEGTQRAVLRVRGLCGAGEPPAFADVDMDVSMGEVLAVVGVAGNGQEALAATLGGMERPVRGAFTVQGQAPSRNLVAYVPEDRHGTATVPELTLAENMLLSTTGARGAIFIRKAGMRAALAAIDALNVKATGAGTLARELSGGNLQKFILARELSKGAPLLVVEQPTQGLDVLAVAEVHAAILKAARSAAVVVITGDPAEALALADRVAVLYRGRVAGVVGSGEACAFERIGQLMAGLGSACPGGAGGDHGVAASVG